MNFAPVGSINQSNGYSIRCAMASGTHCRVVMPVGKFQIFSHGSRYLSSSCNTKLITLRQNLNSKFCNKRFVVCLMSVERKPMSFGEGLAYLFRFDVLSANWRDVVSSFEPVMTALVLAAAPVVVPIVEKKLREAGVI